MIPETNLVQKFAAWSATLLCVGGLAVAGRAVSTTTPPPVPIPSPRPLNVVFILADDMGWNEVGYNGSKFYETPNIDSIARDGMRFDMAYAAAPVCSPSRAALMAGKAPARLHLTEFMPGDDYTDKGLLAPQWQKWLPLEETTIPEMLHTRGYVSGLFGKWHLAPNYDYKPWRPTDPESQGFDEVYHTRKPAETDVGKPDAHHAVSITDHAIDFIERHKDQPFFCYVAHHVAHRPLMEEPALIEKYRAKRDSLNPVNNAIMGAMIERLDTNVGRILAKLHELHLEDNTVVIFTSDNGAVMADQSQSPYRGGKATIWDGGLRVPLAIRWPGVVKAGTSSMEPVITMDLFSTIMEISGTTYLPRLHDGLSLMPILTGKADKLDREALYWHYPHYHHLGDMRPGSAIRMGRYKLIEWAEGTLLNKGPAFELFDVEADPGESKNLADEKPEIAAVMREKLIEWRVSVGAQLMTVNKHPTPQAVPASKQ